MNYVEGSDFNCSGASLWSEDIVQRLESTVLWLEHVKLE